MKLLEDVYAYINFDGPATCDHPQTRAARGIMMICEIIGETMVHYIESILQQLLVDSLQSPGTNTSIARATCRKKSHTTSAGRTTSASSRRVHKLGYLSPAPLHLFPSTLLFLPLLPLAGLRPQPHLPKEARQGLVEVVPVLQPARLPRWDVKRPGHRQLVVLQRPPHLEAVPRRSGLGWTQA